jgi:hypothetical protein
MVDLGVCDSETELFEYDVPILKARGAFRNEAMGTS